MTRAAIVAVCLVLAVLLPSSSGATPIRTDDLLPLASEHRVGPRGLQRAWVRLARAKPRAEPRRTIRLAERCLRVPPPAPEYAVRTAIAALGDQLGTEDGDAEFLRAALRQHLGQARRAEDELVEILAEHPGAPRVPWALLQVAILRADRGAPFGALHMIERLPDDTPLEIRGRAGVLAARCARDVETWRPALAFAASAVRDLDPSDPIHAEAVDELIRAALALDHLEAATLVLDQLGQATLLEAAVERLRPSEPGD